METDSRLLQKPVGKEHLELRPVLRPLDSYPELRPYLSRDGWNIRFRAKYVDQDRATDNMAMAKAKPDQVDLSLREHILGKGSPAALKPPVFPIDDTDRGENGNESGDFQRPMAQIFNCLPAPVVNNFIVVNRPLPTVLNEFMRCRPQLPGPMEFQRALNMKVQNIPGNKRPAGVNNENEPKFLIAPPPVKRAAVSNSKPPFVVAVDDLKSIVYSLRLPELKSILEAVGQNKCGLKQELRARIIDLLSNSDRRLVNIITQKTLEVQKAALQTLNGNSNAPNPNSKPPYKASEIPVVGRPVTKVSPLNPLNAFHANANALNHLIADQDQQDLVRIKELPFFPKVCELIKPTRVSHKNLTIVLPLTPSQVNFLRSSFDPRSGLFSRMVQMRFCICDPTKEQDDDLPQQLTILVNNKLCSLPAIMPPVKQGAKSERSRKPIDITHLMKLNVTSLNRIEISTIPDVYAVTIAIMEKKDAQDLMSALKQNKVQPAHVTKAQIQVMFEESMYNDVTTTSFCMSLLCVLGKSRMETPCRAVTCKHLQCFDAGNFLKMNERKATWICPICNKPCRYPDLIVDELFMSVLRDSAATPEITEFELLKDGSWTLKVKEGVDDNCQKLDESFEEVVVPCDCVSLKTEEVVIDLTGSDDDK